MLSCSDMSDSLDCNPPDSSIHGIFQAGILERVAISYSRGSSWPPGIKPKSPAPPTLAGWFFTTAPPGKPFYSKVKWSEVTQSRPTLCDPMDCSPPGSSIHGIFQAIVLEWIAISFSIGSSRPRDGTQVSCIVDRCFTVWATREVHRKSESEVAQSYLTLGTVWTIVHQLPLSMGFPRQEYWSGLPFPSPGDFPHPRIEPRSPALRADALPSEPYLT